jgi:hypothetical protein
MPIITTYPPKRPHPNCNCTIDYGIDFCDQDTDEPREKQEGSHDKQVGVVPKGGSTTISVTDTARSTDKWHIGTDDGGIESEEGKETSTTSSHTFNHSGETEESEVILGHYDDFQVKKLEHQDCLGEDFWQTRTYYESRLSGFSQVPSSKVP